MAPYTNNSAVPPDSTTSKSGYSKEFLSNIANLSLKNIEKFAWPMREVMETVIITRFLHLDISDILSNHGGVMEPGDSIVPGFRSFKVATTLFGDLSEEAGKWFDREFNRRLKTGSSHEELVELAEDLRHQLPKQFGQSLPPESLVVLPPSHKYGIVQPESDHRENTRRFIGSIALADGERIRSEGVVTRIKVHYAGDPFQDYNSLEDRDLKMGDKLLKYWHKLSSVNPRLTLPPYSQGEPKEGGEDEHAVVGDPEDSSTHCTDAQELSPTHTPIDLESKQSKPTA